MKKSYIKQECQNAGIRYRAKAFCVLNIIFLHLSHFNYVIYDLLSKNF